MTSTHQNILILKTLVEEAIGRKMRTTNDFTLLSSELKEKGYGYLSISTLKRVWGYIGGYNNVRETTLDILSSYVGYEDYRTFERCFCDSNSSLSSKIILPKPLYAKDVLEGNIVMIKWEPNRICHLKHLGESKFEVIDSKNSKLSVGDTFYCRAFYKNQPCFLEDFVHEGYSSYDFVVGNNGGLTHIEQIG
ncbi:MAG: hypothetical protein J6U84_02965 [Bacteroidales bacterium]|jgi:hypothetical protein|nr:hypothetical protein [Bacteroidales bacterium]